MPEISRFFGIVIKMFFDDHNPPHFHAEYGNDKIIVEIASISVIAGSFPPRALGLVTEWAQIHRNELMSLWEEARIRHPLHKIQPLE